MPTAFAKFSHVTSTAVLCTCKHSRHHSTCTTLAQNSSLLLAEALGLLDGVGELLGELVVRLVGREVEPVEAGVRARQPRVLPHLLDAEPLRAVAPHQLGEAAHRHAARPADELQQAGALLVVHRADELRDRAGQFRL